MANFIPSVGMEVHAELMTRSKMFCRCAVAFGGEPNTRVCPVCLGLPGALPVPNRAAIEMVLKTALALNCKIGMYSIFHRKNYFYPDLPKGFQVSQYGETNPLGYHGYLEIPTEDGGVKRVTIRRAHLEEDTGKLLHLPAGGSGVDYNRAGTPLMEIVTGFNPETGVPDIQTPDEAREYLVNLRQILIYLGVCNGKMEEGSLRCEPNISVRREGATVLGTKTELKNLNSFRSVQLGVQFEVRRQVATLESGGAVLQETRGWNEQKEASYLMRIKESENDYRYFPDPDLVPMRFDEEYIESLRASLPELPLAKRRRYEQDLGLSTYDANLLIAEKAWSEFFEAAVVAGGEPKAICNWMNSDFARYLNEEGKSAQESRITPGHLVELTRLIQDGKISGKMAKDVFLTAYREGKMPGAIVAESGASQISDTSAISPIIQSVFAAHPDVVEKFRAGNASVKGFLVGQVMKQSKGLANPQLVQQLVQTALDADE
ncbi:MAG: Asp-tRNA(Asn)/Glu-tRNA(Gln) amidotransferase subunit GatB [Fimbriimonadaceae bacterium]|nr:Asp-tRNA(Asn)/Glu-tRNA(Gln) amidotransferase subunit GatB [Fimbriimonadaceae bacterium]